MRQNRAGGRNAWEAAETCETRFEVSVENSFDFHSRPYLELFARSGATAFQHPLWLDRLYSSLAPRVGAEPLIVTIRRREDGRLVMLLPFVRIRRGLLRAIEFADLKVSDYAAPVCDDAVFPQIAGDRRAREALRALLKPYDLLRVRKLHRAAPPLERVLGTGERSQMGVSAHAVRLYGPYEKWRTENIDPSYGRELDKKRRKLNRQGVLRFEHARTPEAISATLTALQRLRGARFGELDILQQSAYFDFYAEVALRGCESGFARAYATTLDGELIGAAWGLSHRGCFLVLLSGFDAERSGNKSVGALTFENVAEDCIARGERLLDFTVGDEPYKRRFGAQPTALETFSAAGSASGLLAHFVADQAPWALTALRGAWTRKPAQGWALSGRSAGP